jgi:hypothetical protein
MGQDRYEQFAAQKEKFFDSIVRGDFAAHPVIQMLARDIYDMNQRWVPFDYQKHINEIGS